MTQASYSANSRQRLSVGVVEVVIIIRNPLG